MKVFFFNSNQCISIAADLVFECGACIKRPTAASPYSTLHTIPGVLDKDASLATELIQKDGGATRCNFQRTDFAAKVLAMIKLLLFMLFIEEKNHQAKAFFNFNPASSTAAVAVGLDATGFNITKS